MSGVVIPTPLPAANGNGRANGNGSGARPQPSLDIDVDVNALSAEESIAWALEHFGDELRIAVSFQKTSSVIVDMAHRINPDARFFYVDTELLFPETYATRDKLAARYGIEFGRIANGSEPWSLDRDGCCADHKVKLMHKALDEASCWVSGIRRADSETRADAPRFGWDERFGLWKLNPLVDWDEKQIWSYINERAVPYNALHDQGYPSIGCMPCTTVAVEGAGERAGRWAGTDRTECGIHG
jgi:phosphoadenosine phosphosulfate reductase